MEHGKIRLKPRKVIELPSKLSRAVPVRILVANEVLFTDFCRRERVLSSIILRQIIRFISSRRELMMSKLKNRQLLNIAMGSGQ